MMKEWEFRISYFQKITLSPIGWGEGWGEGKMSCGQYQNRFVTET